MAKKAMTDHDFAAAARDLTGAETNEDALAAMQDKQDRNTAARTTPTVGGAAETSARGGANDPSQADNSGVNAEKPADKQSIETKTAVEEQK